MSHMTKLEEMRHQMIEELTQIPQYRALKLMERFIGELTTIYEEPTIEASVELASAERKIAQAIDKHIRADSPLIVKNATNLSVQRVA